MLTRMTRTNTDSQVPSRMTDDSPRFQPWVLNLEANKRAKECDGQRTRILPSLTGLVSLSRWTTVESVGWSRSFPRDFDVSHPYSTMSIRGSFLLNSGPCPAGTPENSPAIYRWVNLLPNLKSPGGAKENVAGRSKVLSSLPGLVPFSHQNPPMNRWAILLRPFGTLMLRIRNHPCPTVAHFSKPPLVFVPQGHPKIAQRFIAGLACPQTQQAPAGAKENRSPHDSLVLSRLDILSGPTSHR